MEANDFYDVVGILNEELINQNPDYENNGQDWFVYETTGFWNGIKFGNKLLWHSGDNDIEFEEEKSDYTELLMHIQSKFQDYTNSLDSLKLSITFITFNPDNQELPN